MTFYKDADDRSASPPSRRRECGRERARTHARTLALASDVLSGAALVSATVTVILYLSATRNGGGRASSAPAPAPPPSPTFKPYVGPRSLGAVATF